MVSGCRMDKRESKKHLLAKRSAVVLHSAKTNKKYCSRPAELGLSKAQFDHYGEEQRGMTLQRIEIAGQTTPQPCSLPQMSEAKPQRSRDTLHNNLSPGHCRRCALLQNNLAQSFRPKWTLLDTLRKLTSICQCLGEMHIVTVPSACSVWPTRWARVVNDL